MVDYLKCQCINWDSRCATYLVLFVWFGIIEPVCQAPYVMIDKASSMYCFTPDSTRLLIITCVCCVSFVVQYYHGRQRAWIPTPWICDYTAPAIAAVQKECLAGTTVRCTRSSTKEEYKLEQRLTDLRTSTQGFPPTSPTIMFPSFPSPFGTPRTCSTLSRYHLTKGKDRPSKKQPIFSSLNSGHMERDTWRRSSERQCPSTLRTVALDYVPVYGASSTSSH